MVFGEVGGEAALHSAEGFVVADAADDGVATYGKPVCVLDSSSATFLRHLTILLTASFIFTLLS